MAKVRAQFDAAGPLIGRPWPLHYRDTDEALVEVLRGLGVRHFTALAYAHRPGMAEFLNDWTADFADRVPEAAALRDVLPRAGRRGVRRRPGRRRSARSGRCTSRSAAFDVRDPLLDEAWGLLADAGTPGGAARRQRPGRRPSSPGRRRWRSCWRRHPRLRAGDRPRRAPRSTPSSSTLAERHERVGARHHDGVHRLLRRDGRGVPADAAAAAARPRPGGQGVPRLATSRTSRTPTTTSSRRCERLDLGDDWLRAVLLGQRGPRSSAT